MSAQRVGGGYSYGMDPISGSPRRPKPVAPKSAVSSLVKEFPASGVRAIEVLQGGATLWTAEEDGSIAVRNGFTGEVAHRTTPQGAGLVERLYATSSLMWVGLNDGGVRVYDHLVVDEEWPSGISPQPETDKPHTGPVHFFCPVYDGSMLSGSTDGMILKWAAPEKIEEDENADDQPFPPFHHIVTASPSTSLTALEAYSMYVIAGDLQGIIYVLDAETLETKRMFEAHPSATVTCLKYMDGMLFSGGSEGCINAWAHATNLHLEPDRQPIGNDSWHESPIRKLIGDPRAHQMWSVDDSGKIMKWESTAPFHARNSQTDPENPCEGGTALECGPFRDLATFASWDAVRVWSTGSNGANFSWFAQWSRSEEQMQEAIDGMQVIIDKDQAGLEVWQKFIDNIRQIDERRKSNLARALLRNSEKGLLYVYKRKWVTFLSKQYELKRRASVAACLGRNMSQGLLRVYFDKLYATAQRSRQERQKISMVENIMCTTQKGLRRTYWKKINQYRHKKKKEQHRQDLAEALTTNSEKALLRKYFKKCMRYLDYQRIAKKRVQVAQSLLRACDSGLLRVYYFNLVNFKQISKRNAKRGALSEAMLNNSVRGMQRVYYLKFCKWGETIRAREQKQLLSDMLRRNTERGLLAIYQQKCDDWLDRRNKAKAADELEDKQKRYEDLLQQQAAEKVRMKRIEALEEMRKKRDALKEKAQELREKVTTTQAENADLKQQIVTKNERDVKDKALRERLNDLMAKLKELALNFDLDHKLITNTADKCKSIAVHKIFLQAHMEVKRLVIGLLGGKDLPVGEEWPIYGKFKKLEKFQYNVINTAIKTLVITYDIMTIRDLNMLETDSEIVYNAQNLMRLYENSVRVKDRQAPQEYYRPKGDASAEPAEETPAAEEY